MPKISIIIPCYNQKKYIKECLDSVLAQTFDDYEVIIVNDGSTDGSLSVISEYIKKYPNFILINQSNQGVMRARNNGILSANGKYIYPLDADDVITPDCLAASYDMIEKGKYRVVASEVMTFGKQIQYFHQPKFNKFEMYGWHNCCVASALFYKEDFIKFGGYKDDFKTCGGEDMDYWLNYIDEGLPMQRIKKTLFLYRMKDDEESYWKKYDSETRLQKIQLKEKLLLKYHPKMKFWLHLWHITHSSIAKIFYRRKNNKIRLFSFINIKKKIIY